MNLSIKNKFSSIDRCCMLLLIEKSFMSHIVLARKYRPQTLSEIVGQDVLVQTIKNALSLNRLPQAILLTGTRGIGKTSTARIIAKYLNCEEIAMGNSTECCNKCDSCLSIANCINPDVLEFDAASKTSVNDIREIIETIQYVPIKSKNKFYIIDEVHMLSNSAFNALLKTLEEPPPHVRFILATTEDNKVPLTIISRCLHFRLTPIKQKTIERRCNEVLKHEGYYADESVLLMISKAANGSMRDALSILEGVIMFCADDKKALSTEKCREMLGYKNHSLIMDAYDFLCAGKVYSCLNIIRELYDAGIDPMIMVNDFLNLIHSITGKKVAGDEVSIEMQFLLRSWHVMSELLASMKVADNHMIQLEMALIKLGHLLINDNSPTETHSSDNQQNAHSSGVVSMQSTERVIDVLIAKTAEDLPSLQKIRLLDPMNGFLMDKKLRSFNHLRILLSFLLDIGETILYHRLSAVLKIISLDLSKQLLVIDGRKSSDVVRQITVDLERITRVKWEVMVENCCNTMTYVEFLNEVDSKHEEALLQTDIVKYILSKFDGFKVEKIKLNHKMN
jgi:DNA polymerase-3 subunit gamma/tau